MSTRHIAPKCDSGAVVEYRTLILNTSPNGATIHAELRFSARTNTAQLASARGAWSWSESVSEIVDNQPE